MSRPEIESALLITGSLWHSSLTGHEHFVDCSCALSAAIRERWQYLEVEPDLSILYERWTLDLYEERSRIMLPEEDPTTGVMHHRPIEQITPMGQPIVDLDEFKMFTNDEISKVKDLTPEEVQDRIRQLEKLAQEARTRQQACVVHLEQRKLTLSDEYRERLRARDQQYKVEQSDKARANRSSGDATGGGVKRGRPTKSKKEKAIDIYMKMGMDLESATALATKTFGSQDAVAEVEGSEGTEVERTEETE